jgi:hypothetical protein
MPAYTLLLKRKKPDTAASLPPGFPKGLELHNFAAILPQISPFRNKKIL